MNKYDQIDNWMLYKFYKNFEVSALQIYESRFQLIIRCHIVAWGFWAYWNASEFIESTS